MGAGGAATGGAAAAGRATEAAAEEADSGQVSGPRTELLFATTTEPAADAYIGAC